MTNSANTVTISVQEYLRLLEAQAVLDALEGAGVDNWQGYDLAMEMVETPKLPEL
jgi:hypothetical protein